jgi:3-oxoacyl-[acyl-carrier-protein] synthase-3
MLVDAMGRDKRFMFYEDETTLTLAIKVLKAVLDKANLKGSYIDALVYSSILSEYVSPPTSILLHQELNLKANVMCLDMNANCAGMAIALENISNYLMSSKTAKITILITLTLIFIVVYLTSKLLESISEKEIEIK